MIDSEAFREKHLRQALNYEKWKIDSPSGDSYRLLGDLPWVLWAHETEEGWTGRLVNRHVKNEVELIGHYSDRDAMVRVAAEWAIEQMLESGRS